MLKEQKPVDWFTDVIALIGWGMWICFVLAIVILLFEYLYSEPEASIWLIQEGNGAYVNE